MANLVVQRFGPGGRHCKTRQSCPCAGHVACGTIHCTCPTLSCKMSSCCSQQPAAAARVTAATHSTQQATNNQHCDSVDDVNGCSHLGTMSSDRRASLRTLRVCSDGSADAKGRKGIAAVGTEHCGGPDRRAVLAGIAMQRRLALQQMARRVMGSEGSAQGKASVAHKPKRKRVHKVCVPFECQVTGPTSLRECAYWADRFMSQTIATDTAAIADLATHMDWVITSCFSGTGAAEMAAHALVEAIRRLIATMPQRSHAALQPHVSCSRVCDQAPHTHKLLRHIVGPDTCIFDDMLQWATSSHGEDLQHRRAPALQFKRRVKCHTHGQCVLLPPVDKKSRALRIEVGGPPCPPWSRMGRRQTVGDKRHAPHQIFIELIRQERPDVAIIEQVEDYDVDIIFENLPAEEWEVRACILDPRIFGYALSRRRMYAIITLRSTVQWNTARPLHELMQALTAKRLMTADLYWDSPDQAALRPLTTGEQTRLAEYEAFPLHHRIAHARVWDLHQGGQRPRGSCVDGALPCFTTNCGSKYHRDKKMFLSPCMVMRAMGHVSDSDCAAAAGLRAMSDLPQQCSASHVLRMAGNSMHVPCIGACLMVVALHVRRL